MLCSFYAQICHHLQIITEFGNAEGFSTVSFARDLLLNIGRTKQVDIIDEDGELIEVHSQVRRDEGLEYYDDISVEYNILL